MYAIRSYYDAHLHDDPQDMRNMGGLRKKMPITYTTFLISTLAIAGIPGLSGFFSKDEILWFALKSHQGSVYLWLVGAALSQVNGIAIDRKALARFAHEAENRFFGKPCGLMDQLSCSVGGLLAIDFAEPADPRDEQLPFNIT